MICRNDWEMHTRSCVRLSGRIHASAAQLCLCMLDRANKKFFNILTVLIHKFKNKIKKHFFLSVTVVTTYEREAMKRSRQPQYKRRDLGILSEVQ